MLERALRHAPAARRVVMMQGVLTGFEAVAGTQGLTPATCSSQSESPVRVMRTVVGARVTRPRSPQWRDVGRVEHWPPVLKVLLKECEALVQGAEATHVEASVDAFCRINNIRARCVGLSLSTMLAASARHGMRVVVKPMIADNTHASTGWLSSFGDMRRVHQQAARARCPASPRVFVRCFRRRLTR